MPNDHIKESLQPADFSELLTAPTEIDATVAGISGEAKKAIAALHVPLAPEAEEKLLRELFKEGGIYVIAFLEPPYSDHSECQELRDGNFLSYDGDGLCKNVRLYDAGFEEKRARMKQRYGIDHRLDGTDLMLAMMDKKISEVCAMGPKTRSVHRPETYEDPGDLVDHRIEENEWGIFGILGLKKVRVVKKPKVKTRQAYVGETPPVRHKDMVRNGRDSPAYSIAYHAFWNPWIPANFKGNPNDVDCRPRHVQAEIILPQYLAEIAFEIMNRDPKLIRQIVAKFLEVRFRIPQAEWMHADPAKGFGIPYGAWPEKGKVKMYLHGPDAPEGFHERYLRDIE